MRASDRERHVSLATNKISRDRILKSAVSRIRDSATNCSLIRIAGSGERMPEANRDATVLRPEAAGIAGELWRRPYGIRRIPETRMRRMVTRQWGGRGEGQAGDMPARAPKSREEEGAARSRDRSIFALRGKKLKRDERRRNEALGLRTRSSASLADSSSSGRRGREPDK